MHVSACVITHLYSANGYKENKENRDKQNI